MVVSRGGISGGFTIADALREFEDRGYVGQFMVRPDSRVECCSCHQRLPPADISLEAMRRVEGVSDPADEVFVGALRCPNCGATGTTTMHYGPQARPEEGEVLRQLSNQRVSTALSHRAAEDLALVRDTGWLSGPDGR